MDPEWDRLQDAFARLQALPQAERVRELDALFSQEPAFAKQLQRLLTAADQDLSLSGSVANAVDNLLNAGQIDRQGEVVGAFRLEEQIGVGGMGVVYRASRIDGFEQTVAIKFLNTVIRSADLVQRFAAERQILARLEHPYIARLIDGGTTADNEPYLVMEYVRGQTLTEYCKTNQLTLKQRLRLFTRIIQAVDFAHRTLVIHRDLKPSNILITDDGVPRLLDFGIADLLSKDGEQTNTTIGLTPEYASPEQLNNAPVTIATDVYSLGVLLYQLLTDQLPHNPDPVTIDTMRDAVTNQPTPKPSKTEKPPVKLDYELDAIVGHALAEDIDRRYASADLLLRDIQRYLNKQPLEAIGHGGAYRVRKFLQRHAAAAVIGTTAVMGLLLLTGIYITNVRQARDTAQAEADKANRIAGFMEQLFEDVDPGETQGSEITASQLLEQGLQRVDNDFAELPEIQVRLRGVIGRTWRRLGNYQQAYEVHHQADTVLADSDIDNPRLKAQVLFDLAYADFELGRLEEALQRHRQALTIRRELYQSDHAELADSLRETGLLEQRNNNREAAEGLYQDALAMYSRLGDEYLSARAATLMDLAGIEMAKNNRPAALELAMQSLDTQIQLHGEVHPEVATATNNISIIHNAMGAKEEALRWIERSIDIREQLYGEDNPITLHAIRNYANQLWGLGRTAQAIGPYRHAYFGLLQATTGDEDLSRYFSIVDMINMLLTLGAIEEAHELALAAMQRAQTLPESRASLKASVAEALALAYARQDQFELAKPLLAQALEYYAENPDSNVNNIARAKVWAAATDYQATPTSEKLVAMEQLIEKQLAARERLPTETGSYYAYLAEFHAAQGNSEAAADYADRMLEAATNIFDTQSIEYANFQVQAMNWYLAAGQPGKLPLLLEQADQSLRVAQTKVDRDYPLLNEMRAKIDQYLAVMDAN